MSATPSSWPTGDYRADHLWESGVARSWRTSGRCCAVGCERPAKFVVVIDEAAGEPDNREYLASSECCGVHRRAWERSPRWQWTNPIEEARP